ncbi:MAG: F0F1 ATP synthase subunit B [Actinomycetes bacterium]
MHTDKYLASNFLVPNGTFIAELFAFLIILWAIYKYVVPPLQKSMNERQELIRRQIEESKEAREKLEQAEQEYKDALAEARHEATQMREQARADGQRIRKELEAKAREDAANIAAANQRQMEIERQRAMRELRTEIGTLAVELATRIVGESLEDDARQRRTVDRFIAEVEEASGERAGAGAGAGTDTAGQAG